MRFPCRSVATLVVVVVAGCGASGSPGSGSPVDSSASATPSASLPPSSEFPEPSVLPTAASPEAWVAVPEQVTVQGLQFDAVIWTGARFVASGHVPDGGRVIADSTVGLTWQWHEIARPDAGRVFLAAGPKGVVAVGGLLDGHAGSWTSADGIAWTAHPDTFGTASGTDTFELTAVIASDDGWLAVGREDPACNHDCGLTPIRALVWTSSDGLAWTRVADQRSLAGGAISAVARLGSGFVAVGLVGTIAAAWTSPDGRTWNASPTNRPSMPVRARIPHSGRR